MADDKGAASARAKAEARRQRILESSGERMGVVSGQTEGQAPASTGDTSAPSSEGTKSSNGMSKYAAARRRRYGNKKAAAPAAAEEKPAEDKPAAAEASSASASETKAMAEAESEEATAPATASETESTKKDEKKYLGVAKMRRKMLAEKKKKKEEGEGGAGSSTSDRKLGVPRSMSTVARETVRKHRAAVLMQLFTLALLFLAGLGVGMQNHALNEDKVVVSEQLSFKENGIGALRILGLGGGSGGGDDAAKEARELLLEEEEKIRLSADEKDEVTDEFGDNAASTKPKGVGGDDEEKVPNIDPLFRVDLDELVAGSGLLNMAGRVAIKFHRFLMYLILVLPVSILNSILALPRALMSNPPILFILTIVIRFLGRDLLGAKLPDLNAAAGGGVQEDGKDLFSSVKNMLMSFLSSSFPNAAKCIEVMADAREDMFVILFGLFVGLVLPIHLGKEAGKDEL